MKKIQNTFGKKKHQENKTGTKESYKPIKIKKGQNEKKYETWKH